MSWPIDPRFNIFNDPPGMEVCSNSSSNGGRGVANGGGGLHAVGRGGEGGWGSRGSLERPPPSYAEVICFLVGGSARYFLSVSRDLETETVVVGAVACWVLF